MMHVSGIYQFPIIFGLKSSQEEVLLSKPKIAFQYCDKARCKGMRDLQPAIYRVVLHDDVKWRENVALFDGLPTHQ